MYFGHENFSFGMDGKEEANLLTCLADMKHAINLKVYFPGILTPNVLGETSTSSHLTQVL